MGITIETLTVTLSDHMSSFILWENRQGIILNSVFIIPVFIQFY